MIKVIHFHRKPRPLGNFSVETYYQVIRNLMPKDINVIPFVSKYESSGFFKRLYNAIEAIFHQGDINHITGDVHFLSIFLNKKKTILNVLDCGMLKDKRGLAFQILKFFWFTLPAKRVSLITVISEATKADLLKYININPDRIKVLYVCISSTFTWTPKEFNSQKPRILQIGTAANKNIRRLAEALNGINCKLVIIGMLSQDIIDLLNKFNIDYENISKKISEAEIVEEYKKCDILTLVSTLEGFGMPIVEANAVGRVVITANLTSMPEIAADAAHIVDPYNIEEIKAGFKKLIADEAYRNSLIKNGRTNCIRFSQETITMQHYQLYKEFLNSSYVAK